MKANFNLQSTTGRRQAILKYLTSKPRTSNSTITCNTLYNGESDEEHEAEHDFDDFEGFDDSRCVAQTNADSSLFNGMGGFPGELFSMPMGNFPTTKPRRVCTFTHRYLGREACQDTEGVRVSVEFTDEEYIELLDYKLQHPEANINSLTEKHPNLFRIIEEQFANTQHNKEENILCSPDYIVEMTEVEEDIQKIIQQYGQ